MIKLKPTLIAALLALSGTVFGHEGHKDHGKDVAVPAPATQPQAAQPLKAKRDPQAYFTDREVLTQDGKKLKFYSDVLKGKMVVMGVMYTNCEEACPLITEQLKKISQNLGPQFGKDIIFVQISSDPARDTPQALKAYAAKHKTDGPGWVYLTGKKTDIDTILKKLGSWSEHIESHSTQLIAWNFNTDKGRKMLPNMPPEAIAQQISFLASDEALPIPDAAAAAAARASSAN